MFTVKSVQIICTRLGSSCLFCSVEVVSWRACNLYDIAAGEDLELIVGVIAVGSPDLDRVANEVLKAKVIVEDAEGTTSVPVGFG